MNYSRSKSNSMYVASTVCLLNRTSKETMYDLLPKLLVFSIAIFLAVINTLTYSERFGAVSIISSTLQSVERRNVWGLEYIMNLSRPFL